MVFKKKTAHLENSVETEPVALEEAVVKEARRVPVTQVVEVVEDEVQSTETVSGNNEALPVEAEQAPRETIDQTDSTDEKRKELVDELFQKRIDTPVEVAPEISMHRSGKRSPIYMWAIGVLTMCVVIGLGLLVFSKNGIQLPTISAIPTPTPVPSKSVSPTPTLAPLNKEELTIQVLNGGGKAGAATKMKTLLVEKGYTVKDTGNADAYTYETTEIHVKPAKKDYLKSLEDDVKTEYTIGTTDALLEDTSEYDVKIIVGLE